MTRVYQLSEAGKTVLVRRLSLWLGGTLIAALGFSLWNMARQPGELGAFTVLFIVVFLGIVVGIFLRARRQQRALLDSIQIVLGEDFIARRQANIEEVRLRRDEVTQVREISGGLCVLTHASRRSLLVPKQLAAEDYQSIRHTLSAWAPLQPATARSQWMQTAVLVGSLAGFAILFLSSAVWLILPIGLVLVGYYFYLAWVAQKSEGIDARTRRGLWMLPVFVAFITSLKVCVLTDAFSLLMQTIATAAR